MGYDSRRTRLIGVRKCGAMGAGATSAGSLTMAATNDISSIAAGESQFVRQSPDSSWITGRRKQDGSPARSSSTIKPVPAVEITHGTFELTTAGRGKFLLADMARRLRQFNRSRISKAPGSAVGRQTFQE